MSRIAVVLPAYNEESTLGATVRAFRAALPEAEIWVVDNNSTDATRAVAVEALRAAGGVGGVIAERRKGKGNAVRRAFMDIDADAYVLADADQTYPADEVRLLLDPVLAGTVDMAVGDRHSAGHYAAENKRVLNGVGNRLVRSLVNGLFHSRLADIMSGYRVMSRRFVKNYPILSEGFEIETEMTLHALDKRFRILEVPINYRDRPEGSISKLNTMQDGARVVATIFHILRYYRPLVFFGGAGVLFFILGLYAGMPVIEEWLRTRYINRIPLAILASGLEVIAIIMVAIGLILDSITHQSKQDYERNLLKDGDRRCGCPRN